jgi:hypothetical protein
MKVFCALIVVLLIILAASRGYDDQLNHEAATYVSGDGPHTPQDWYEASAQARYARRIEAWESLPRWAAGDFPEKNKYDYDRP